VHSSKFNVQRYAQYSANFTCPERIALRQSAQVGIQSVGVDFTTQLHHPSDVKECMDSSISGANPQSGPRLNPPLARIYLCLLSLVSWEFMFMQFIRIQARTGANFTLCLGPPAFIGCCAGYQSCICVVVPDFRSGPTVHHSPYRLE
jgi:hypothetical protein